MTDSDLIREARERLRVPFCDGIPARARLELDRELITRLACALEFEQSAYAGAVRDMGRAIEEVKRLREALELIAIVDQGCGGYLRWQEMAESAMAQARAALRATEGGES